MEGFGRRCLRIGAVVLDLDADGTDSGVGGDGIASKVAAVRAALLAGIIYMHVRFEL